MEIKLDKKSYNQNKTKIKWIDKENNSSSKETPLKVIPIRWLGEVGGNMMLIEYRSDIIVIDAGMLMWIHWMPGVDYIIPDVTYLISKREKIRGIVITHGHLDHIWAIKHIMPDLWYPPIYGTPLSMALTKKSLEEKKIVNKCNINIINPDIDLIKLWCFTIEFFRVNHSIPEAVWLNIHTPKWNIVHSWDFKIDFTPAVDKPADLAKIARIWQEGVLLFFSDSTNAHRPGTTPSEKNIWESLENSIKNVKWRLIIATFSSLIWRIKQIIEAAVKYNKIIFLWWRSMINNMEIAKKLGYINVPNWLIRPLRWSIDDIPDNRVVVLTTGSQWEEFSALVRIAKDEHPHLNVRPWDTILLSSSPIPWNERSIVDMINNLITKWADVTTNNDLDIHVSWHAQQDELKLMLSLVKPKYFIPVHGELFMREAHKKLAVELWNSTENIFLINNWDILNVFKNKIEPSGKKIKLDTVIIDWLGVWHLSGEYVIKARKIMAESWILTFIIKIDTVSKNMIGNVQIESRGFVYSSEVRQLHTKVVDFIKHEYKTIYKNIRNPQQIHVKDTLKIIKSKLENFITAQIWRAPMIIPMYVYTQKEVQKKDITKEEGIIWLTLDEQWSNNNPTKPINNLKVKYE